MNTVHGLFVLNGIYQFAGRMIFLRGELLGHVLGIGQVWRPTPYLGFTSAAYHSSFTVAAEEKLGCTQSSISRMVASLEKEWMSACLTGMVAV